MLTFALKQQADFVLVEIGGTVGDMEGQIFLETVRQIRMQLGQKLMFHGHLSYVPFLEWTGEIKTKPTQHSVNALKEVGLIPDCLFLRASKPVPTKSLEKLATMCGVDQNLLFHVLTYNPIYKLFLDLKRQGVAQQIQHYFSLPPLESDLSGWEMLLGKINHCHKVIKIALVAKYVGNNDPYISVVEAIKSASFNAGYISEIIIIEAENLEKNYASQSDSWQALKNSDGVIIPGGFDLRGSEGKIAAVRWAHENRVPYLGLCLGMQVMIIEFARSLLGFVDANTTEFNKITTHPVISLLEEQEGVTHKGGSMRLGASECEILPGTKAYAAYQDTTVVERHRHRYEFNNKYKQAFEQKGVVFSGVYKAQNLVEIAELQDHPFMVGVQFHPEFLSSPLKPHPLFKAFIEAILIIKKKNKEVSV
jgi:CTP synthase